MTTFWRFWDAGGNWLVAFLLFLAVESPMLWGHHSLSLTLQHAVVSPRGWLFILAYQALGLYLFVHFFAAK
jgi:hypothetical protein